jgi:uncharacterized protein (UPF0335 family)
MTNERKSNEADQLQSLLDTIERLRRERFSGLDSKLVAEILRLHADSGATEVDLGRGVEQLVDQYLARGG